MHVWIFDNGAYPSGCANGLLARERPDCIKKYLAQRHVDALGPMEGSTVLVGDWLDLATAVDLTSRVRNGILYWDIPEGNGVSSSLSRPIAAVKNGQKII